MADGDPPPPPSPHEKVENLISIKPLPKQSEPISSTHQVSATPTSEASNQLISGDLELPIPSPVHTTLIGSLEINLQTDTSSIEAKNLSSPSNKISLVSNHLESESFHQGKPMVTFNHMEKSKLINGLKHVLIAKFSHRRPALTIIKSFFQSLNVKGLLNVSLFDSKHVVVECEHYDDFVLIWIKKFWTIAGSTARIFKWDANFHPSVESSITPIWIHLPCLPLFFYDEWALLKIAKSIGRPLFVDKNNLNRRKLAYATICVELDVSKPVIDQLWIRFVGKESKDIVEGYWQKVVYDIVPPYCYFCHHVGHRIDVCKRKVEQHENQDFRQDENRVKIKGKKIETGMIVDQAVESDCSDVKYTPAMQNLGCSGSMSGVGDTSNQLKIDSAKLIQMPEQSPYGCIEEGEITAGDSAAAGDVREPHAGEFVEILDDIKQGSHTEFSAGADFTAGTAVSAGPGAGLSAGTASTTVAAEVIGSAGATGPVGTDAGTDIGDAGAAGTVSTAESELQISGVPMPAGWIPGVGEAAATLEFTGTQIPAAGKHFVTELKSGSQFVEVMQVPVGEDDVGETNMVADGAEKALRIADMVAVGAVSPQKQNLENAVGNSAGGGLMGNRLEQVEPFKGMRQIDGMLVRYFVQAENVTEIASGQQTAVEPRGEEMVEQVYERIRRMVLASKTPGNREEPSTPIQRTNIKDYFMASSANINSALERKKNNSGITTTLGQDQRRVGAGKRNK